jgi:hypothetical protein
MGWIRSVEKDLLEKTEGKERQGWADMEVGGLGLSVDVDVGV